MLVAMTVTSPLIAANAAVERHAEMVWLDARAGETSYAEGHVVGAWHADLERDLSSPGGDPRHGGRHPLPTTPAFAATLSRWGISQRSTVAIYDDQSGGNAAARAWWMLRSVGHDRVAVVDGGFAALLMAGAPIDRDRPAAPQATVPYPATAWQWPLVDADTVATWSQNPAHLVLDVRAPERYRGEVEPLDPVAGHIPGAANLFWRDNLDEQGVMRDAAALRRMYETLLAGRAPEAVAVQCGSGVTACHTLLALEVAGLQGAALYVGSWSEWCASTRATETGGPQSRRGRG